MGFSMSKWVHHLVDLFRLTSTHKLSLSLKGLESNLAIFCNFESLLRDAGSVLSNYLLVVHHITGGLHRTEPVDTFNKLLGGRRGHMIAALIINHDIL